MLNFLWWPRSCWRPVLCLQLVCVVWLFRSDALITLCQLVALNPSCSFNICWTELWPPKLQIKTLWWWKDAGGTGGAVVHLVVEGRFGVRMDGWWMGVFTLLASWQSRVTAHIRLVSWLQATTGSCLHTVSSQSRQRCNRRLQTSCGLYQGRILPPSFTLPVFKSVSV